MEPHHNVYHHKIWVLNQFLSGFRGKAAGCHLPVVRRPTAARHAPGGRGPVSPRADWGPGFGFGFPLVVCFWQPGDTHPHLIPVSLYKLVEA